jgi:hypothetical protein
VYTKRCLGLTQEITQQLFKQPLALVQLLGDVLGWTTLLMAIVVSCLLGITAFVSLLRTYQHSAILPSTTCGESSAPASYQLAAAAYQAAGPLGRKCCHSFSSEHHSAAIQGCPYGDRIVSRKHGQQ